MTYGELRALYPSIDRVMERMRTSIAAGLDPEAVLAWGLEQVGRIRNPQHRRTAEGKVEGFWEVLCCEA